MYRRLLKWFVTATVMTVVLMAFNPGNKYSTLYNPEDSLYISAE